MSTYNCRRCGTAFEPKDQQPAHMAKPPPQYCSRACGRTARRTRVVLVCRQCQTRFERKFYQRDWSQERGPFCGFRCYAAWQSEHTRGEANPGWKRLSLDCEGCDQQFLVQPSEAHRRFCSRPCFHAYAKIHWVRHLSANRGRPWKVQRAKALKRDRFRCRDCRSVDTLVVHHKRPFSEFLIRGMSHALGNLMTLCASCHLARHASLAKQRL